MINKSIWIGITIGVFFAGLAIGIIPGEIEKTNVQKNIERFDYLDFVSFNEQDWETFNEIHASDVLVGWPDGRETHGIDEHGVDVEFVFTYAPDVKITDHPISFGQGPWTAGMGIVEGTFSEPMILPDGTVIEPTGKKFKYTMVTIAKWEDGQITEEYLYWDNAEVARQMGLMSEPVQQISSEDLKVPQQLSSGEIKLSYSNGKPATTDLDDINTVLYSIGVHVSTLSLPEDALPILKTSQTRALHPEESDKLISIFSMDREELLEQINKAGRTPTSPQGGFLTTSEDGVPPYPKVYDMKSMTPEIMVYLQEKFGKLHVNSADSGMGIDEVMTIVSGGQWTWFFVLPDGTVAKLTLGPVGLDGQAWRISYPGLVPHGGFLDAEHGLVVAYAHGPEEFVMRYEEPNVNGSELLGTNSWIDYSGETPRLLDGLELATDNCGLEPDPGLCKAYMPRYYFDETSNSCQEFVWGGCNGVVPFETLSECQIQCNSEN